MSDLGSPKAFSVPLLEGTQDSEADVGNHDEETHHVEETNHRPIARPGSLRMLLNAPTHTVHHYWRKFDDSFMRPVFGGRGFVPFVPGSPTDQSTHHLTERT